MVPSVGEGGGVVPGVVEEAHAAVLAGPLLGGDLQAAVDRLLAHRRVRAQRDHHVEARRLAADEVVNDAEEQADRGGARRVGHDQQHPLAGQVERGERVRRRCRAPAARSSVPVGTSRCRLRLAGRHRRSLALCPCSPQIVIDEKPPSTTMFWPVTNDEARGAASQTTAPASSCGFAEAGHRRVADDLPAALGVAAVRLEQQGAVLLGGEEAGADGVDAHAPRAPTRAPGTASG